MDALVCFQVVVSHVSISRGLWFWTYAQALCSWRPSAENTRDSTGLRCPGYSITALPVATSTTSNRFHIGTTRVLLSGENARRQIASRLTSWPTAWIRIDEGSLAVQHAICPLLLPAAAVLQSGA